MESKTGVFFVTIACITIIFLVIGVWGCGPRKNKEVEEGKQLFIKHGCVTCHGLDGAGQPGKVPNLNDSTFKELYPTDDKMIEKIKQGDGAWEDSEMMNVKKKENLPIMPVFEKKCSNEEIVRIVKFIRTLLK
ncbi:MAG: cytochrome c [Armatimonadetes bacterium]|nr:cytochrome c [Armatimonadota bacterium]